MMNVDQLLAILSAIVEEAAKENARAPALSVTLLVNGSIVTGTLIGGSEFYSRFPKALYESVGYSAEDDPDSLGRLEQGFNSFLERIPRSRNDEPELGLYYYLSDATIVMPSGGRVSTDLWKGRRDHVSGWSIGGLEFGE